MKTLRITALLALTATLLFAMTPTFAGGGKDHRVRAELTTKGLASGSAKYRERDRDGQIEQRFDIEVEDGMPGAMWDVHVNELLVGIIVVDEFGFGELQYRTADFIDDPGDGDPIPDGFPTLIAGDTITVGPLAGVFELD